ncbi:MAG: 2-hydroxyacyl-CoA dehydratase family protein [Chloroflexota bacterium]|nr:2-hydroxyacyl-CoA dehydratase family protein [Chloroflexota bacterium]
MVMTTTAPARRGLQTSQEVFNTLLTFSADIQKAKDEGKPVIWSSILIPPELLHAVGAPVVSVEVLSALISISQLSGTYCQITEEQGFSRDVCAFQRCYMGCILADQNDSFSQGVLVPPDMVVASNFCCMSSSKSFLFTVDRYKCPYFFLDTPLRAWQDSIPREAIDYYVIQLKNLIHFLEEHGYKYEEDRLRHEIDVARRTLVVREEIERYATATPAPIAGIDGFLSPLLVSQLVNSDTGLALLEQQRDELKERVENGIGVIDNEQFRLFWFGLPALYNMELLQYPEQYGGVIVRSVVEWLVGMAIPPEKMDPDKPLESLAVKALSSALNPPTTSILDFAVDVVRDYKVDGVVGAVKRSCGLIPGAVRLVKDAVFEKLGVPTVVFDLDYADQRDFDEAAVKANLEPFFETIMESKRRG